ncbi:hypothetical protein BDW59DRAFT_28313 [Aspergillus cavernicola]|uniref:Uncharacterized protein n=1 Tax=Aspergillus cavernicola TaxID=176166 RepID=A0ABR4ISS3_9EURO
MSPWNEIGNAPQPKAYKARKYQKRYYSGYEIWTETGRREWQRRLLANLSYNGKAARLKLEKLPGDLSSTQKAFITTTQEKLHREAIEEEEIFANTKGQPGPDTEYCLLQKAFSGTDNRSGPPVDLCMQLVTATRMENGLYKSELLEGFVVSHFYHYQMSGAIGIVLKLYEQINAETLLRKTGQLEHA